MSLLVTQLTVLSSKPPGMFDETKGLGSHLSVLLAPRERQHWAHHPEDREEARLWGLESLAMDTNPPPGTQLVGTSQDLELTWLWPQCGQHTVSQSDAVPPRCGGCGRGVPPPARGRTLGHCVEDGLTGSPPGQSMREK